MAVTAVGFDGTINEADWARIMRYTAEAGYRHAVPSGMVVSVGAGTREVSITAGEAVVAGVFIQNTDAATLALDANAGSKKRVDIIAVKVDWATNAASLVVVKGSSSTPPTLTQTEGTLWYIPLARVTVLPGAVVFTAGDIEGAAPLRRRPKVTRINNAGIPATEIWASADWTTLVSTPLPDPGWPYVLQVQGCLRFKSVSSGRGQIRAVTALDVELGRGLSELLSQGDTSALFADTSPEIFTGTQTIRFQMQPYQMAGSTKLTTDSGVVNHLTIIQIPA